MDYISLYNKVLHYFIGKTSDEEEARDLTQSVFEKISLSKDKLSHVKDPQAWLFRIARNLLIDQFRKRKVGQGIYQTGTDDTEEVKFRNELLNCVNAYMNYLDEETRFLLTESELKGKSQKELARDLGLPYPTVRSKIQRGRAKIKAIFLEKCNLQYDSLGRITCCTDKNPNNPSC